MRSFQFIQSYLRRFILFPIVLTSLFICSLNINAQNNIFRRDESAIVSKANRKLEAGDIPGALKILDKAIDDKEDALEAYRKRSSIRFYYQNDVDGAISDLDKALEIKPEDVRLYISRAHLKKVKQDFGGALLDYQTAQKYDPDSIDLFLLKARLKASLKDISGAIVEIQTALKIHPQDVSLHVELSSLFVDNNELAKAIAYLQDFLAAYVSQANGKLPQVKGERIVKNRTLSDSTTKTPIQVRRHSEMDFNIISIRGYEKQMAEIEKARGLARAFIYLGKLYVASNDIDKAFKNLNTALEIDKNQEEAYGLRGILYLTKDEYDKAIVELSKAINIADEPHFYLNRGISYLAIGRDKQARSDFDYFLKIYPDGQAILDKRIAEINQKRISPIKPQ